MKNLKTPCVAIMLMFVLSLPAFAGEMTTWIANPSPPPSSEPASETTTTVAGQMETLVAGQISTMGNAGEMTTMNSESVDPVTQAALSLFQGALSLF